jgi:hypothetical protein
MTGQVKEEVLSRFGELGLRVAGGAVRFDPGLLRSCEFGTAARPLRFLDVDDSWQELEVPEAGLAFTWCQVPIVYRLRDSGGAGLSVTLEDGTSETRAGLRLSPELSEHIFRRSGRVRRIVVDVPGDALLQL